MINVKDIIPQHVKEKYPLFVEYLKGYYEWLQTSGPVSDVNAHLSRKTLQESSDEYNKHLSALLLGDIPANVFTNKEIALQWSKKIHSAKGSKQSIKFLFKLLYGEDVSIFLPKTNLFELSVGKWVSNEKIMYCSIPSGIDLNNTNIRYLKQTKSEFGGAQVNIVADVQRIQTVYSNKLTLLEVYMKVDEEFDINEPVYTQDNIPLTIVPSTSTYTIDNAGINYQVGDRIYNNTLYKYTKTYEAVEDGFIDTELNSFLSKYEITVLRNSIELSKVDFRYENNVIYSDLIEAGDIIEIQYPASQGLFIVKSINTSGGITDVTVLSSSIGIDSSFQLTETDAAGENAIITITPSVYREIEGRYLDERGRLSADSYLHDSNYYQNYSYVIQTEQDISTYSDILTKTVHPAGMKFFGSLTILSFVRNLLRVLDLTIDAKTIVNIVHKYGLGPSYKDVDVFKNGVDDKFYPNGVFDLIDLEPFFFDGDSDRDLIDLGLLSAFAGVMTQTNLVDCHITMPDDYIDALADEYCDTEYISSRV